MNRIKLICLYLLIVLIPTMACSNGDGWLWEQTAKPLDIDLDSTRKVIICTPGGGCQSATVYGD